MTSITSEMFHEDGLHIGLCYNDILIEWDVSNLHIRLTYNESLQRGGKWTNQDAKKIGVQTRNPLQVMTQEAMRA